MKLNFFKSSVKPTPNFSTIEVEFNGNRYGYFPNWFRRDGDNIIEVPHSDIPDLLIDYKVDASLSFFRKDVELVIQEYRDKLKDKLSKLDDTINKIQMQE